MQTYRASTGKRYSDWSTTTLCSLCPTGLGVRAAMTV